MCLGPSCCGRTIRFSLRSGSSSLSSKRLLARVLDLFYIVGVMPRPSHLGGFEHVVLLALVRLEDRAYGVTVRREIENRTQRNVSIGAVYATLDRLESKGYVKSSLGDPTPERGGRSKRFFRITAKGVAAVNRTHTALQRMTEGLKPIWSNP